MTTGSHGAGDPSETLTPLVTWGAGLRSAQYIEPSTAAEHSPQGMVRHEITDRGVSFSFFHLSSVFIVFIYIQ